MKESLIKNETSRGLHILPDCHWGRASFKVYEDDENLGFLDIFPNTEGFSVVIPKEHQVSDFAKAPEDTVMSLLSAARKLAVKITTAYDGVDRCAVVMEGMMIDHLHAKVIPLHQTAGIAPSDTEELTARSEQYFKAYPGYITTRIVSQMADRGHLTEVANKINAVE